MDLAGLLEQFDTFEEAFDAAEAEGYIEARPGSDPPEYDLTEKGRQALALVRSVESMN